MNDVARIEKDSGHGDAASVNLVLAAVPASVATARHAVGRLLRTRPGGAGSAGPERPTGAGSAGPERPGGAGSAAPVIPSEVAEDVLLLVSELVTNAVLHAGTAVRVSAWAQAGRVRVAVGDDDPLHSPRCRDGGLMATSGRGMQLVEVLASSWGVEVRATSKVVWFETAYPVSGRSCRPTLV